MMPRPAFHAVLELAALLVLGSATAAMAQTTQRVKNTVHNLSASGPGAVRAQTETEVCVFCHTPHGSSGVEPLWNRRTDGGPYQIYRSSSLKAKLGQPTGASKLCLSCHDGTIALGEVLSRDAPIRMAGEDRIPAGPSRLGTDLSDDHPVSFAYAASITQGVSELYPPAAIPPPIALDQNGELQCTSCHEPHDNSFGDFLVRANDAGALCLSCHRPEFWRNSAHAASSRPLPAEDAAALGAEPSTPAQNACNSCHRTHGAAGRPWLLDLENISATCIVCHDGSAAASDIGRELRKTSRHGMSLEGAAAVESGPFVEGPRVSCADCHDPHAAGSSEGSSGGAPASLAGMPGITLAGAPTRNVQHEHELCFRCHGDSPATTDSSVSRRIVQPNVRLQFQPTNPSFHPVGNPGVNGNVPSLIPSLTTASTIGCGDCHASDGNRKLGGAAPAGPHGSIHEPLLALRYELQDFAVESPDAYALCYRCHQRDSILRDDSFKGHRRHIVDARTPCSVCHDPHGISSAQGSSANNSRLINFDRAVVFPNGLGKLEYVNLGVFRGECSLSCHGKDHNRESY
jgi:predicted CXXCH cytochrome family protein